jgi:hypothetical protein
MRSGDFLQPNGEEGGILHVDHFYSNEDELSNSFTQLSRISRTMPDREHLHFMMLSIYRKVDRIRPWLWDFCNKSQMRNAAESFWIMSQCSKKRQDGGVKLKTNTGLARSYHSTAFAHSRLASVSAMALNVISRCQIVFVFQQKPPQSVFHAPGFLMRLRLACRVRQFAQASIHPRIPLRFGQPVHAVRLQASDGVLQVSLSHSRHQFIGHHNSRKQPL